MSVFDLKVLQRVRFWVEKIQRVRFSNKIFSTCQILKNWLHSKVTFWFILLRDSDIFFTFLMLFLKAWF